MVIVKLVRDKKISQLVILGFVGRNVRDVNSGVKREFGFIWPWDLLPQIIKT